MPDTSTHTLNSSNDSNCSNCSNSSMCVQEVEGVEDTEQSVDVEHLAKRPAYPAITLYTDLIGRGFTITIDRSRVWVDPYAELMAADKRAIRQHTESLITLVAHPPDAKSSKPTHYGCPSWGCGKLIPWGTNRSCERCATRPSRYEGVIA
jgi:hypothetical protein